MTPDDTPERRPRGRRPDELRPTTFELDASAYAEGSCIVATGDTRVLCTASVEERVPAWREGSGKGWVTAEYAMLPRATHTRRDRERAGAGGRTREIERLVGRSLRSVTDLAALGPRTVILDCDVLQADGGTRTASITGAWIALERACRGLVAGGLLDASPVRQPVAAVSVGIVDGVPVLDLDYPEDAAAQVDMNVVATGDGRLVEVQGTAEGHPFTREEMERLMTLALDGIGRLVERQGDALRVGTGSTSVGKGA